MAFRRLNPPQMHLLLEDEASFDDDNLFHDGEDGYVALLANGRHSLHGSSNGYPLHNHMIMTEILFDESVPGSRRSGRADKCLPDTLGSCDFLFVQ